MVEIVVNKGYIKYKDVIRNNYTLWKTKKNTIIALHNEYYTKNKNVLETNITLYKPNESRFHYKVVQHKKNITSAVLIWTPDMEKEICKKLVGNQIILYQNAELYRYLIEEKK